MPEVLGGGVELVFNGACERCPALVACRNRIVYGSGNLKARVMVIGEAPGEPEDLRGIPFSGPSGDKLAWMLGLAGLKREDVFVDNTIKCHPPGNRDPLAAEVKNCREHLIASVEEVSPSIIVTMGKYATQSFGITGPLKNLHGRPKTASLGSWTGIVVPMYHPAYYMRNPNIKGEVVKDWRELWSRISAEPTKNTYKRGFAADIPNLVKASSFAFDLETTGATRNPAIGVEVIGFSVCVEPRTAWYFPDVKYLAAFKDVLENPAVEKICHNTKYEYMVLKQYGITLRGYQDTKIMAHLLGYLNTGLKDLTYRILGEEAIEYDDVDWTNVEQVINYGAGDADHTYRIYHNLLPSLREADLEWLYSNVEVPLVSVLGDMEIAGIPVSIERLRVLEQALEPEQIRCRESLNELVGEGGINPDSPKQLQKHLYETLKLPVLKRTKTEQPSTDEDALEAYKGTPFVDALIEYRGVSKFLNTYVRAWQRDAVDGVIHPQWKQVGDNQEDTSGNDRSPITGRLSSSGPNFQNIPKREDAAKPLRECILAPEGYLWLSLDYAHLELRVLAEYLLRIGDDSLAKVFWEGRDPHTETAKIIGRSRDDGKKGNFAIVYGAQVKKLMESFPGMTREEAKAMREALITAMPGLPAFIEQQVRLARERGAVWTLYGRRRLIPKIWSKNRELLAEAEREAVNMPIQGTAADIVKTTMVHVKEFPGLRAQIHDDLKYLVREEELQAAIDFLSPMLENGVKLKVPLLIKAEWGKTW